MSDKKSNLNDFFKKENKKKAATKPAPVVPVSVPETDVNQDIKQATKEKTLKKDDYESSEEEKTDLLIGDEASKIKDKKVVEAEKRKLQQDEENSGASGWKKLEDQSKDKAYTTSTAPMTRPGLVASQPKGPTEGLIKAKQSGPPKFSNKNKNKQNEEDFPELGGESKKREQETQPELSKKDRSDIGMFGSSGVAKSTGFTETREPREPREERKEATKPTFTSSKKKALVGGDQVDTIQNSKQNYDFSALKTSAATDKVFKKDELGEDGKPREPRERREYQDRPSQKERFNDFEDDFIKVQEKQRKKPEHRE